MVEELSPAKRRQRRDLFMTVYAIIVTLALVITGIAFISKLMPKHRVISVREFDSKDGEFTLNQISGDAYVDGERYLLMRYEWRSKGQIVDWSEIWTPRVMVMDEKLGVRRMDIEHVKRDGNGNHQWKVNDQVIQFPEGQRKMILVERQGKLVEYVVIQNPDQ